jgi:hypothetical protein
MLERNDAAMVWKRFRRRTFAPRRPAVFPEDAPLVVLTLLVLAGGIAFALAIFLL